MIPCTAVYIVGNGESRKNIDLHKLQGPVFGCNALYRDFTPAFLVAGDTTIVAEIRASNYSGNFILRNHKTSTFYIETPIGNLASEIPFPKVIKGLSWYSGVSAAYVCTHFYKPEKIYLIGFDALAQTVPAKVNNVYKNTAGYSNADRNQNDILNLDCHRRSFKEYVFDLLPNIQFIWVNDLILPEAWSSVTNLFSHHQIK